MLRGVTCTVRPRYNRSQRVTIQQQSAAVSLWRELERCSKHRHWIQFAFSRRSVVPDLDAEGALIVARWEATVILSRLMRLSTLGGVTLLCLLACRDVRRNAADRDAGANSQNGNGGNGNTGSVCVAGTTQECVGPGACEGAQECLPDRSGWSPCDCGSGSGNAGSGNGGTTGGTSSAGTSNGGTTQGGTANGGSGGTVPIAGAAQGGAGGMPNTAGTGGAGGAAGYQPPSFDDGMVQYVGNPPHSFGVYDFSTAEFYGEANGGLIVYQTNGGTTILNVVFTPGLDQGWAVHVALYEQNADEPEILRGTYEEPAYIQAQQPVPVPDSCSSCNTLQMVAGGTFQCTLDCALQHIGNGNTANLTGSLVGTWPAQ